MVLEKYHTSSLDLFAPNWTFTRLANRFLKDCKEVLGMVPDEVQSAADAVRQGKLLSDTEDSGSIPRSYCLFGVYREKKWEWRFSADEEDGRYILDYYFFSSERFDRTYCGVKHVAGSMQDLGEQICRRKGPIRYFCTHRPPARGCIPEGYATYEEYPRGQRWIGEVTYFTPPPDSELRRWGLQIDPDWLREWSAKGFNIYDLNSAVEESAESEAARVLAQLSKRQRTGKNAACPRCGQKDAHMEGSAKSKYADVTICSRCVTHERGLDCVDRPLPLSKWAYMEYVGTFGENAAPKYLARSELK